MSGGGPPLINCDCRYWGAAATGAAVVVSWVGVVMVGRRGVRKMGAPAGAGERRPLESVAKPMGRPVGERKR